jgi:hypothetical protein
MSTLQSNASEVSNPVQSEDAHQQPQIPLLEGDAFKYYAHANLEERYPFRSYQRGDNLYEVVSRINRPLTLEEITKFVYEDGPALSETCVACDKKFTPVTWVDVLDREFLKLLVDGASPLAAFDECLDTIKIFGCFYFSPEDDGSYGAFCGSPYFYSKGSERYVSSRNCLSNAKNAHPQKFWGM